MPRKLNKIIEPCIYKIVNTINGKFYVGSCWRPWERMERHWRGFKKGSHPNAILRRAVKKYGWPNFQFETIRKFTVEDLDRDTLYRQEQMYIDCLKPHYNLAKVARGGDPSKSGIKKIQDKLSMKWIVTNPNGEEFKIKNLKNFCRENGISQGRLWYVANGRDESADGWKCRYDKN
jgi:group I intron endonuclease